MSVRCVERDLWDAVFSFFLFASAGPCRGDRGDKRGETGGGELKAAAHTSASMIHLFLTYFLQAILIIWRGREVGRTFY